MDNREDQRDHVKPYQWRNVAIAIAAGIDFHTRRDCAPCGERTPHRLRNGEIVCVKCGKAARS